jgi:catechol 2,3-dioxygenase-like lactoylglutathione lyase family enzyme
MIIGIHHAQITIPKGQENAARMFYCRLLGFKEVEKPPVLLGRGGLWVQVGGLQLHIGTEDGVDRTLTKAHLAYEVQDLRLVQLKLREAQVHIYESVPIPGYDRMEIRDPFGNRVEFIQTL